MLDFMNKLKLEIYFFISCHLEVKKVDIRLSQSVFKKVRVGNKE